MSELTVIATLPNRIIAVGGNKHSGWLPVHAVEPLPTPVQEIEFTFELQFDGSGYLLSYSSLDDSTFGDTWCASLAEAEQVALNDFGIGLHEWQRN
jgi:hypothetical protein